MFILKRISFVFSMRQLQPSHSSPAFLRAHVSLCFFVVGWLSRSVSLRLSICCKLVGNKFNVPTVDFDIIKFFIHQLMH